MSQDAKTPAPPKVLVSEIMTAGVHRVTPEMKVYEVIELLTKYRISGAPVVDQIDLVLTVISEGDVMRLAASEGLDATIAHCLPHLPKPHKLVTLEKSDTFTAAYKLFMKHSLHRIIVVDGNGRLHGLVSRADILRLIVEARHGKKVVRKN